MHNLKITAMAFLSLTKFAHAMIFESLALMHDNLKMLVMMLLNYALVDLMLVSCVMLVLQLRNLKTAVLVMVSSEGRVIRKMPLIKQVDYRRASPQQMFVKQDVARKHCGACVKQAFLQRR